MQSSNKYPEDRLELLGFPLETLTPETFYSRICSLHTIQAPRGKSSEPKVKGKRTQLPTKKREGSYELSLQTVLGEKKASFTFPKSLQLSEEIIKTLSAILTCKENQLKEFLLKKKFSFY